MENKDLYSNGDDCKELAKILKTNIRGEISFSWNVYGAVMGGSYNCIPNNHYDVYPNYDVYLNHYVYLNNKKELVNFYYKFNKDAFLRIGVGDNSLSSKSIGHKLAVLSDFYRVLFKMFGDPTVFYTTKNDDQDYLHFQWSFNKYKDSDIEKFKNGTIFDDDEIKDLIIIGESQEQNIGYQLNNTTKRLISNQLGLPFELLELVNENINDFIEYRQIDLNSFNDDQPTATNEKDIKRFVKN